MIKIINNKWNNNSNNRKNKCKIKEIKQNNHYILVNKCIVKD